MTWQEAHLVAVEDAISSATCHVAAVVFALNRQPSDDGAGDTRVGTLPEDDMNCSRCGGSMRQGPRGDWACGNCGNTACAPSPSQTAVHPAH